MILAGTGHRPNKLGGYGILITEKLIVLIKKSLEILMPTRIISGMALGFDTSLSLSAISMNIPLTAAIPFASQEQLWPDSSQEIYQEILSKANTVQIISPGGYSAAKMQIRNEWMVDNSNTVLALYDGQSLGGTRNCLEYACKVNKLQYNLWDSWMLIQKQNVSLPELEASLKECLGG